MNKNSLACNDDSLRELLRDDLPLEENEGLLDHLEGCVDCKQKLCDLVASDEEWTRLAKGISACLDEIEDPISLSIPLLGPQPITWTESMAQHLLSPASHPEMLGRLGRYEVERLVGSGGMGVVFKAYDSELNRTVAIKILAPYLASSGAARKRFSREARAAAAVVHQHVVPIHNVETDRESPFIVMQFVSGESLQNRIDREGPLGLCEILRIGMQVADGLAAAHQQGLVHRDIKPSNILLEEEVDRALVSDFGLARAADDASMTRTGFHPGTPQYMSPEQASGQRIDARSDLFSMGSMLYTMCTGRPPFRAENSLSVMRRIVESDPTPIRELNPEIPVWLCGLVEKLMAKRSGDRFQSAGEVHELLEACLGHVQQPEATELPRELSAPAKRSLLTSLPPHRKAYIMLGIAVLATLGFLLPYAWDEPQGDNTTDSGAAQVAPNKIKSDAPIPEVNESREPQTWNELGLDRPNDYPTAAISLIQWFNRSRGIWKFTGRVTENEDTSSFSGQLRISGGFSEQLENGHMPVWVMDLKGKHKTDELSLMARFMLFPEKTEPKLMLVRTTPWAGRQFFDASWNADTRSLTLVERELPARLAGDVAKGQEDERQPAKSKAKFTLTFGEDQSIQLREVVTQGGRKLTVEGQTIYREKAAIENFSPPKPDPTPLPNGFAVFVASRSQISLHDDSDQVIVSPNIVKIGSSGDLIYGKIEKARGLTQEVIGYFVLDSGATDRNLVKGLSEVEWIQELKKRGHNEAPVLVDSERKRPRADWQNN